LLEKINFSAEQRQKLSRAIMQEEDDRLNWKVAKELMESWTGIRRELRT